MEYAKHGSAGLGGPEFVSSNTETFLKSWGVSHRLSSVANPHANCRAEVGVKTVKRMITGNTGPGGILDSDNFQKAVLQYRNSPDPVTKISPAMAVFGRPVKDLVAILPGKYLPHQYWRDILRKRCRKDTARTTTDGPNTQNAATTDDRRPGENTKSNWAISQQMGQDRMHSGGEVAPPILSPGGWVKTTHAEEQTIPPKIPHKINIVQQRHVKGSTSTTVHTPPLHETCQFHKLNQLYKLQLFH